jgi:hypothetical protein
MKAPCKKRCGIDSRCKNPEECKYWKQYVLKQREEREKKNEKNQY